MSDSDSSEDSDSGRFKTASSRQTFISHRRRSPPKSTSTAKRRSRSRSSSRNHRNNSFRNNKDQRDASKEPPRKRSPEKPRDIKERPKERHDRQDRHKEEDRRPAMRDHQKISKRSRSKSKSRSSNSESKSRGSTSDKKACHDSSYPRHKSDLKELKDSKDSKHSREREVKEVKDVKKPTPAPSREEPKKNSDAFYGPALPPAVALKKQEPALERKDETKSQTPPISREPVNIGPALPPSFKKSPSPEVSELELSEEEPESRIGPIIPRDLQRRIHHYSNGVPGRPASRTRHHYESISSSENDEDFVGPVPSGSAAKSARDLELEKRKLEMKLKELDDKNRTHEDVVEREEWMTVLPKIKLVNHDFCLKNKYFI